MEESQTIQEEGGQCETLMIEGNPEGHHQGDRRLAVMSGEGSTMSEYKSLALATLDIRHPLEEELFVGVSQPGGEKRIRGGEQGGASSHGELLSEIDRVMLRVEEAMNDLEGGEGNKRVRRSLETSATELRSIVKQFEDGSSGEAIKGARMEDGKVILLIASESSGESGERKRKRRDSGSTKAGCVASRLRKKTIARKGKDDKGGESARAARTVVRKVKASAKKPSTSLMLAPPTLGLPNE